jgi:hypothetical protein
MKRIFLAISLSFFALSLFAADAAKECSICVGAVTDLTAIPATPVPQLATIREEGLAAAGAALDAMTPDARAHTAIVVGYRVDPTKDPLLDIETHTKAIIEWARAHGPLDAIGIAVEGTDAAQTTYAIKRLAVSAQGQNAAARIVLPPAAIDELTKLADAGAMPYVDALLVDAANVTATAAWIVEKDPAKKMWAIVAPQSPNVFYDLGRALADGAARAYLARTPDAGTFAALAAFDRALIGEYAYDATARIETLDAKGSKTDAPSLVFVRGEDLRTIVIPRGDAAAATITSLPGDFYVRPRRIDAAGERDLSDVGQKGGRFLIGVQPVKRPFVFTVEHNEKPRPNVTKEALEVATQRGISVEEIIRNHQAYKAYQESIQPRYIAQNTTKLRFTIQGGEALEAAISGKYFFDPNGRADWVWSDFFINGVRWKYGRIPELPLIQPEKVTQLPLDIHLTNEYRYQFVRETDLLGYRVYEVRFEPPQKAPESLPLYRGTVWIDTRTWARVRISMVQLNLTGNVLSNEERVDFAPFARATHAPMAVADVAKSDAREILWLPAEVGAQQVVSAAGRANVVLRSTTFTDFRIEPEDFQQSLAEASASDARMVRETSAGMRYLEKSVSGERVVKEGFESSRKFLLGGVHHDAGLEYPVVPLGGVDYFDFDLWHKGIQANVFFAGVVVSANATHPNVANTRTNLGADFFAIAVPTTNSMYRAGLEQKTEAVKALPTWLALRGGHPFATFGKIDFQLGLGHIAYKRGDDTDPAFAVPSSTFLISPTVTGHYARWGYTAAAWYDYTRRTTWEPWGNLAEYDPNQKSFSTFGASLGKSFYLPKFQRLGLEVDYLDGKRLDRFSKYELGFFGTQRIHGVRSGTVRAERAILGHVSYGFVVSDQLRMEAFYDHGLIDDGVAGYRREPFQGIGIAGQTVGPYGTLLRLDIGKMVGRNAQSGFVANVVFLKLF